jgi:hypothetical protein
VNILCFYSETFQQGNVVIDLRLESRKFCAKFKSEGEDGKAVRKGSFGGKRAQWTTFVSVKKPGIEENPRFWKRGAVTRP